VEPIRHCDDLWIDAMVCVGFNLAHGSRQKMQSIFRTSRPLTIIFYLVFFLLVITIPNHSERACPWGNTKCKIRITCTNPTNLLVLSRCQADINFQPGNKMMRNHTSFWRRDYQFRIVILQMSVAKRFSSGDDISIVVSSAKTAISGNHTKTLHILSNHAIH